MLHKTLINRLKKIEATIETKDNHRFYAKKNQKAIAWFTQGDDVICLSSPSPHTDVMTDCFCDSFHRTIKEALNHLNP